MDRPDSFESYTSIFVMMATGVRNGTIGMPDISKLDLKEAQFFLMLVKDDAFYDFWCLAAGKSQEYLQAIKAVSECQEELERAEAEFNKAKTKYRKAIAELRRLNPVQEQELVF